MLFRQNNQSWPLATKLTILGFIIAIVVMFNLAFTTPILLGLISATLSFPIYNFFYAKIKLNRFGFGHTLAALTTILGILGLLIFVLQRFSVEVAKEAPLFISGISEFVTNSVSNKNFIDTVSSFGINPEAVQEIVKNFNQQIQQALTLSSDTGVDKSSNLYSLSSRDVENALKIGSQNIGRFADYIIAIVIFILAWFYGLTQGKNWMKTLFNFLPFSADEEIQIKGDLKSGVQNVVYANILSGAIHAGLCFLIMFIFGIDNIFILTFLIFLIGVLPLSPSELGYAIPLFLIANKTNDIFLVIILGLVFEGVIIWVNYILIPGMIASKDSGNGLLILTSIISGVAIFGLMGFIIGPVLMILAQTMYRILTSRLKLEQTLLNLQTNEASNNVSSIKKFQTVEKEDKANLKQNISQNEQKEKTTELNKIKSKKK